VFEEHSTWNVDQGKKDDDYNINLVRDDHALYTSTKGLDSGQQIHSEFDAAETALYFSTPWLANFVKTVNADDNAGDTNFTNAKALLATTKGAQAIGMLGLDCAYQHSCDSELHPLWVLAIHVNDREVAGVSNVLYDHWAFFARNIGDEGYCSDPLEKLYPLSADGGSTYSYRMTLPRTKAGTLAPWSSFRVVVHTGPNCCQYPVNKFFNYNVVTKGLQLIFTLPNPDNENHDNAMLIEGDLYIDWK
jgi:hypothetical protein